MKYNFPKIKLNKNGLFGPTKNKKYYKPVFYHNKSAQVNKHKTQWVLKQNEQYEVFKISDEGKWVCIKNNGLFSILQNGNIVMGSNEERLSFFPQPVNTNDPWHGYPVDCEKFEISEELIERWYSDGIIDDRIYIKILRGQL